MKDKPYKVERVGRQVIEEKLLTALESNDGHVAILAAKRDLLLFLAALQQFDRVVHEPAIKMHIAELSEGLQILLKQAFP